MFSLSMQILLLLAELGRAVVLLLRAVVPQDLAVVPPAGAVVPQGPTVVPLLVSGSTVVSDLVPQVRGGADVIFYIRASRGSTAAGLRYYRVGFLHRLQLCGSSHGCNFLYPCLPISGQPLPCGSTARGSGSTAPAVLPPSALVHFRLFWSLLRGR